MQRITLLNQEKGNVMRILLIGNGFDLAHDLPTKYGDFLVICEQIDLAQKDPLFVSREKRYLDFCNTIDTKEYTLFCDAVLKNCWIEHFVRVKNTIGEKWIDFETEIRDVVLSINKEKESSINDTFKCPRDSRLERAIKDKCGRKGVTFKKAYKCLNIELDGLTKALDLYFAIYVSKKEIVTKSIFKKMMIDRLLSFNYTPTFGENYLEYTNQDTYENCYIHGETDWNKQSCNLVLGFDDHYLEKGNPVLESVPFEKYYQRIVKLTDNNYLEWLKEIENEDGDSELYIYGHSLAPSDGDILKVFICCPQIQTHIFYLDDLDRAEKVQNLAVVLGPDKLIELAGGRNKRIDFLLIDD